MTSVMEQPITPLMRELNRLLTNDGNAFAPPADVLVDDDGVLTQPIPKPEQLKSRRIPIAEAAE